MSVIRIRRYEAGDLASVKSLHDRVGPFRPEDEAAVRTMHQRAAAARVTGNRWFPHVPDPQADSLDDIEGSYAAFWVAVDFEAEVVGMVGVRAGIGRDGWGLDHSEEWKSSDVAELRRLRVAPEVRRQGVGAGLTQMVIDWARQQRFRMVVLNTTSPQAPARALYKSLGFREQERSFLGEYELVWYSLEL